MCDTIRFDLRPDGTYKYYNGEFCLGPYFIESGRYSIIADTIFLTKSDTTAKPTKLLYLRDSPTENNPLSPWHKGNIAPIIQSETILPISISNRLSDYEILDWGYIKMQGYYDNNVLMFKTEVTSRKTKTTTNYYASGKIKSIEQYYFDKHYGYRKTGDWYFYNENGKIEKIETYKRGKLKRINNALK